MNAAEKARLAKEKEEQAKQQKRAEAEQKRKEQLEKTTKLLQRITGVILLLATAAGAIVTFCFGVKLLWQYVEDLTFTEILFGSNRGGKLDLEYAKSCWILVLVDLGVLGLDLLHFRWNGKMLSFENYVGWATFIIFAVVAGIFLLVLLICMIAYWMAR